ncbi:MAG: glutathione S-transferase family protein, partial [Rhizobiaceae bacterium]
MALERIISPADSEEGCPEKAHPFFMMLTIYAVPISLYCAKLRIVLRHKQLEWTEVPPPGGYGSKEYKALVPAGSLPALDHDGFLIGDSEAIAEYLNETFPIPDMLDGSAQKRAKIRELSRFHDTRWEPSVRALFPLIATANRDEVTLQQNWAAMVNRLEQMTPLLPDHAGDLTLADCGLVITGLWVKELAAHFGFTNPVSNLL